MPSVVRDIADGLDYYWAAFRIPELYQYSVRAQLIDPDSEEELTPVLHYDHGN